jgi:hypothetical protein
MAEQKTFHLQYMGCEHPIGDRGCQECEPGEYPIECECGGLIHSEITDYTGESERPCYVSFCDRCGGVS